MPRNPDVDAWFAKKAHPLEDAMQHVRTIVLETDSRIEESIKWQTPTFYYKGNIASFNPAKRFVSLMFHRGGEIPGEFPQLEGDSAVARVMRFADVDDAEAKRADLDTVVRAWCAWRDAG